MEKSYRDQIDPSHIPSHVAVIMDGNGRWAKSRGLPRVEGHKKGSESMELLIDSAIELGIRYVSVYAFSTENWSRPKAEIKGLWTILDDFFNFKLPGLINKGVRIVHSGSMKRLPKSVQDSIRNSVERSRKNKKIVLNLCINYGGKQEVLDAVNEWAASAKKGETLTEAKLSRHFYVPELPDVDLMIRTSGEQRVSNFLLWQGSYAELIFMDVLWPDFRAEDLHRAIYDYQKRTRRFGGI